MEIQPFAFGIYLLTGSYSALEGDWHHSQYMAGSKSLVVKA